MAEYINREAVKEIMQKYRCSDCTSEKSLDCPLCQLYRPFAEISQILTANVVEVVWCKDCKYFYQDGDIKVCKHWNCHSTIDDAYCSYGERRKEDAEIH